jgi:hypothetical protein
MHLPPASALLASLILVAAPVSVAAQAATFEGTSIERFLGQPGHAVAFNYRRTEASRLGLGLDLAIGVYPVGLLVRTLRLQVDAGLAYTQRLGPAAVVLKAGAGNRVDLGLSTELIPGLQAGVAAIVPVERRCGLRVDLTRRVTFPEGRTVSLWSLGVGLTIVPARRPPAAP